MSKRPCMIVLTLLTLCVAGGGVVGCSGTDDGNRDGGGDGSLNDTEAGLDGDSSDETNIGTRCTGVASCLPGSPICLTLDQVTTQGICTRTCKPDSPATPGFNEDDCPIGSACGSTVQGPFCFKTCNPSLTQNACGAESGLACRPDSSALVPTGRRAVCLFDACADGDDCPVLTADSCTGDATCKQAHGDESFCLRSDKLKLCALPGNCSPGGICGPHGRGKQGARVGDPCKSDLDCTNNGFCWIEQEVDGLLRRPNGYCSIANCAFPSSLPEFDCAGEENATCHFGYSEGYCHRVCDPEKADSCRRDVTTLDQGGDYECYNYEQVVFRDGRTLSQVPICESARRCSTLGQGVSCEDLGISGNPENMGCRDRATGDPKAEEDGEKGVCLDDTTSGEFEQGADAGVGADADVDAG